MQLLSTHLYCVCQALDLRYLEFTFRAQFDPTVLSSLTHSFSNFLTESELEALAKQVRNTIWRRLESTTSVDLEPRWIDAFAHVTSIVLDALSGASKACTENPLPIIAKWRTDSSTHAIALTRELRDTFHYAAVSPTSSFLGRTKVLYEFVRGEIGVKARRGDVFLGKQEATVGSGVSLIYESIKSGRINPVLVKMMNAN